MSPRPQKAASPQAIMPPARPEYPLDPALIKGNKLKIAVIGVGGTGSEVMSGLLTLHQALVALGRAGLEVHAFDPDTVSQANLVRQRYYESDIGKNKAQVLVRRINAASGLSWKAWDTTYDTRNASVSPNWDIVLSCVDTRSARAKLHHLAQRENWKLWVDYGNEANFGQVIIGEVNRSDRYRRKIKELLPWATQLHPDLIDTSVPEDDAPSCSAMEALSKQDLTVNKMVADFGMTLLWQGLKSGKLHFHGYYFNLETGQATALGIPEHLQEQ